MKKISTPLELKTKIAASDAALGFVQASRRTVQKILLGEDSRLLAIVGPCSIHNTQSALSYAEKLSSLAQEIEDTFFVVMRAYIEKPRTLLGWKGLLYDPNLSGVDDLESGLIQSRTLFSELAHLQMPVATELLSPFSPRYFEDLLTWGCIGARTTSSQVHRELASGLEIPIGFKNSTEGAILPAVQGALAARSAHTYLSIDDGGQLALKATRGNPWSHIVLRGGKTGTNFDPESIASAIHHLKNLGLHECILVDCSHDNAGKLWENQIVAFRSVIEQKNRAVRGVLLESFLSSGAQKMSSQAKADISVTDPCLDFETTRELLLEAQTLLKANEPQCVL